MSLKDLVHPDKIFLELPIIQWIDSISNQNSRSDLLLLFMKTYRKTNQLYDQRFTTSQEITTKLNELLYALETDTTQVPDESNANHMEEMNHWNALFSKVKHVVQANILLRRGQVKANQFIDPSDDYQMACTILAQYYKNTPKTDFEFLDGLIQLNLGKYFRNMGMYSHRSDCFLRALDEFENLLQLLAVLIKQQNAQPWHIYLWLEASMNLIRTELYLNKTKDAKIHLWMVYLAIHNTFASHHEEHPLSDFFAREEIIPQGLSVSIEDFVCQQDIIYINLFQTQMKKVYSSHVCNHLCNYIGYDAMLGSYLIQILVRLGIAYRKTRDYAFARILFGFLLSNDSSGNVDALNNYAVCLRKYGFVMQKVGKTETSFLETVGLKHGEWNNRTMVRRLYDALLHCLLNGKNKLEDIKAQFIHMKMEQGIQQPNFRNRFATIEYIRSFLGRENREPLRYGQLDQLFNQLLEQNPNDCDLLFQKGIFLQKTGKLKESSELFQKLYLLFPQMTPGSIARKAYYHIGCNLLAEKKFYKARTYFLNIRKNLHQNTTTDNRSPLDAPLHLSDLPDCDLLAEIDHAWCLMNIGDYRGANECYEDILSLYHNQMERMGQYNEMRVRNNHTECLLQLLSSQLKQKKTEAELIDLNLFSQLEEIDSVLCKSEKKEPHNHTVTCYRGYYHILYGILYPSEQILAFQEAMKSFETSILYWNENIYAHSGWVNAAYHLFQHYTVEEKKDFFKNKIELKLRYGSGPYSIHACAKLAKMLDTLAEDEKNILYGYMSYIQIGKTEAGFTLFQELQRNTVFESLEPVARGKLLSALFQLYSCILEIKDHCRYYPNTVDELPVHYRSLARLKTYLKDDSDGCGKLSLWNIAYMNDYYEGKCFLDLLCGKCDKQYQGVADWISQCFFHSNVPENHSIELPVGNDHIYISSLSLQKDEIPMWVAYAENGSGCALTYSEDFLDARKGTDTLTDVSSYSDQDYPLYRVLYVNTQNHPYTKSDENRNMEINTAILEFITTKLTQLCDLLYKLQQSIKSSAFIQDSIRSILDSFVACCINEIRFLFKDQEYSYEQEIRMIHYSNEHLIDTEHSPIPRLYIEIPREVQIERVLLGPKIDPYDERELVTWLGNTGKVKHILRSKRHYH